MTEEGADAAMAFVLRLDSATQLEVLRRYEEAFQVELDTTPRRLRRIAVALHQTSRTLGRSPSLREYKALRAEHPESGWPDPRSITRWLGVRSWNDALVRMRLEPVLEGDVIEGAIGPTYSIEEVIQAVRDCAEDLGRPPTITDYLAWQRRPDVRERPGRRPAGTWVFNRLFGGFPRARVAAGLVEGEPTAAHPSELVLRTANYRLSDEQILKDLRDVAARVSGSITATVYDHERRLIYQETRAAGRPRALAGVGSIYRHFGSWLAALEEAGVGGTHNPASIGLHLGDRQIVRALAKACAATTGPLTIQQYMAWRRRKLALDPTRHSDLPSYITIYRRFGSWPAALQAAAADLESVSGDANEPRLGNEPFRPTTERDQQIVRALAEAHAATTGPLTIQQYTAWRRNELARDPTRRTDLPSYGTIYQHFGSWRTALQVAGADLDPTSGDANEPRLGDEQFPPTTERGQQIVPALAEAHAATTGALTVLRYLSWREQQLARNPSRRDELPSLSTVYRSFGSFSAALHAAGIDLGRIRGRAQGGRFSDEQLLRTLHDAEIATGGVLSVDQYLAWREQQSAGDPALRKSLPMNTTFGHRFGSWTKALEQMRRWRSNE